MFNTFLLKKNGPLPKKQTLNNRDIFFSNNKSCIFEKSPAGFNIVKSASIFNPHTLKDEKVAVVKRRLNLLLTHLEKQKILSTAQCDKMAEQFLEFSDYDLKVNIVKFENFSSNDTNLHDF